jgi:aspartyl/asparaginyl beta-hydroxylase (cupin superfamily)
VSPNYLDWEETYPSLCVIKENWREIAQEAAECVKQEWIPWPEDHVGASERKRDWTVFPFLHTFPALDESKSQWIASTTQICPRTTELLRSIPNLRTALFSRLGPSTQLAPHTGWSDLANYVLRCHICLHMSDEPLLYGEAHVVDEADDEEEEGSTDGSSEGGDTAKRTCGMWVEGEIQYHSPGNIIVFDDSKRHKAFNYSNADRIVLIMDLLRPMHVAPGTAKGGHTSELNELLDKFT